MLTAINRVHLKNGPFVSEGGYEYNLVLIAVLLGLVEVGPGSPSLDEARGSDAHGTKWALLSLLMGGLGAVGAHLAAEATPAPEQAPGQSASPAEPEPTAPVDPAQAPA